MTNADWLEPGAHQVAPGVHRIPLPLPMDGLRAVNVYVMESDQGLTLIDGGWALEVSRKQLEASLRSIGHHPRDITSFLVTHVHRDHYTQAITIRKEFNRATVALGLPEKRVLDLFFDTRMDRDPTIDRLTVTGAADHAQRWREWSEKHVPNWDAWDYPDRWLEGEESITVGERTLDAIPTPGHTQGHYVFADQGAGLLFAGDHVLPTITPSIGFEPAYADLPLGDYLASLLRMRELPDLTLLPAHGPVTDSSHRRVDELLAHHDVRLEKSLQAVRDGGRTAYDVARQLGWTRHERAFDELDLFNGGMALMETLVHLDLLVARGLLQRVDREAVAYYSLTAPATLDS